MRTPLNGLLGMLQLADAALQRGASSNQTASQGGSGASQTASQGGSGAGDVGGASGAHRYVRQAHNSGKLLLSLISDLLDLSRIQARAPLLGHCLGAA